MALPDGMYRFVPPGQEELQNFIRSAANQSVRPYNTNEEYLYAMKEDLAEWFKELYQVNIFVDNFIEFLQDGILLCEHANIVNERANEFREQHRGDPVLRKIILPSKMVQYNPGRHASSFFARDNVANFINWCRKELLITEAVMFESNDLILRKNEKNFILCLLEVARRGSKFGVPAPVLIQMEEDIDQEIENDLREEQSEYEEEYEEEEEAPPPVVREPPKQKVAQDFKSLDEMVQYILGMCTCPDQFPMVKVSEGKYKVGNSKTLIFMRILRNHVMVRVGGGWDTLEHYLDKHDPCRCNRHKVEQKIAARFKCSTKEYFGKLVKKKESSLSVKQANDIMSKGSSPRNSETRKSKEDWSDIRSQSLPGFAKEMSTSPGRGSKVGGQSTDRSSKIRKSEAMTQNNDPVQYFDVDKRRTEEKSPPIRNRSRSRSPAPDRGSKNYSLAPNSGNRRPEITLTESDGCSHDLNKTYPVSRVSKTGVKKEGNLQSAKTNLTPRSKTPTPVSMRSTSTSSMPREHTPRRSVTPTPTTTSQKRAALSLRSKSPLPDRTPRARMEEKVARPTTPRNKGPPSAYRNSETLPRNYRTTEKMPRQETAPDTSPSNNNKKYNSSPRSPSPAPNRGLTETDSRRPTSALSIARGSSHHRSMQDVNEPRPARPKSALGIYSSTSNLSTVPANTTKNQGRTVAVASTVTSTVASTQSSAMQRLTTKARSQSMDNLSIQKQISGNTDRNMFFERMSQPKTKPKSRSRSNLLDEDVLFVERKGAGTGSHTLQRNSVQQRPDSPRARRDHPKLDREKSTDSDASSQSTHQQQPITPSDLRLRLKRDEPDKRSYRGQSSTASSTPSPSKDSALPSSLKLSVSMTGSPDSPSSRVSYSWTGDSGGDELESPSSRHPAHTPKIIDRRSKPGDSHLKAPPKRKVSREEVLHVVRNPEGHHQWEHTDASIEQSQEYIDMSPYKDQHSPRSSIENRPAYSSSIRKASSSSDSSAFSHGLRNPANTIVSKAQIVLGKPVRSTTPNRLNTSGELRVSNRRRNDPGSTSSSSMGSTLSSVEGNRRRAKVTEQVRNMLFTEDGKVKPVRTGANKPTTPRSSTLPRTSTRQQRPTTPRNESLPQQRSQSRPTTPGTSTKYATTPRSRPKTPENRRNTFTRQEKLKSWDGPSLKKEPEKPLSPTPRDKETKMLQEFEKELSENQKILAQSGDSEDALSGGEPEVQKEAIQYDYNGRRIRKKTKPLRSKSPSNIRSKSQPRMDRYPSCDSEATNRSIDFADSIADSEDFEVAMAMTGGAMRSGPSTIRSRSVDDFLDDRGPRPRKDRHENRKSRIPTPVHFNSGRKSVTGVPYHDSEMSKTAIRSNIEGVGSYEIEQTNQIKDQRSFDDRGDTEKQQFDQTRERLKQKPQEYNPQKENIQPSTTSITSAEEYDLDGQECFKFGRYGNSKTKPPRKNIESRKNGDFVDGPGQYYRQESVPPSGYKDICAPKQYVQNYNSNNNNNSNVIGHSIDQSEEPIPPPRKKSGYHRSNLHSSPADLLKPNQPTNQIHSRQNVPTNQINSQVYDRIQPEIQSPTRGHLLRGHPHDRNDSGIELGTDPESPGSSSAISIRSTANGDISIGARSASSGVSVFSPEGPNQPGTNYENQSQQNQYTSKPNHGVKETATGKYYYVSPGQRDPRLHTGYDASKGDQSQYQSEIGNQKLTGYHQQPRNTPQSVQNQPKQDPRLLTGYDTLKRDQSQYQSDVSNQKQSGYHQQPQNTPKSVQNTPKTQSSYYQANQSPKPTFHQQGNQYSPQKSPSFDYTSARNQLHGSYQNPVQPKTNLYIPGYQKNILDPQPQSTPLSKSPNVHQYSQNPPTYEQERPQVVQYPKTSPIPQSPVRQTKRPSFNDFFDDNRKLKDSLNNLSALYSTSNARDTHGTAFQLEDDPYMDDRSPRSNAGVQRSRESFRNALPQYSGPPSYGGPQNVPHGGPPSTIYTQSHHRNGSNNSSYCPPVFSPDQFSPGDSPPAPPPRQKSSYKPVMKTKLDNLGPKYYSQYTSDGYAQGDPSGRYPDKFQFPNGQDLQQANDDQDAMYV